MGRRIRKVDPDRYYFITNRTLQGIFFFRPDARCIRIIKGCLAKAAEDHGVEVVCFVFMSNHFHLIARFPNMNMAEFMGQLQGQIADRINTIRGDRSGTIFPERYHDEVLLDDEVLKDKIGYVVNNPVKDFLVTHPEKWPGVSSYDQHATGDAFVGRWFDHKRWHNLKRRKGHHSKEEAMVRHEFELHVPECFDGETEDERREAMLELIEKHRERFRKNRSASNRGTVGPKAIRKQRWTKRKPFDRKTKKRRLCVGTEASAIADYHERHREMTKAYRRASKALRDGTFTGFPVGTYPPGWYRCVRPAKLAGSGTDDLPDVADEQAAPQEAETEATTNAAA